MHGTANLEKRNIILNVIGLNFNLSNKLLLVIFFYASNLIGAKNLKDNITPMTEFETSKEF
jgi:hypothetical protein